MPGTVLIVNSYTPTTLLDDLRTDGLAILTATRPELAAPLLTFETPDVLVTDLVFFESAIDGPTFIREARSHVSPTTSILVVSGYVRQEDRRKARLAGADSFLMKPVLPSAIVFEIHRALILKRSGRRLPWNWSSHEPARTISPVTERRRRTRYL